MLIPSQVLGNLCTHWKFIQGLSAKQEQNLDLPVPWAQFCHLTEVSTSISF